MLVPQSGLRKDEPSWPLLVALISYWGTTDNNGNVGGTTIRCAGLVNEPSYINATLKLIGGPCAGQTRDITLHPAGTDTLTVRDAFTNPAGAAQQIVAGTSFVILSTSDIGAILNRTMSHMDFWSTQQENVTLPAAPANQPLPNVVVAGIPLGAVVIRAVAMFKFRMVENTNAAVNALAGAQSIQIQDAGAPGYVNAITFVNAEFTLAGAVLPATTREGGDVSIGSIDVAAVVVGNGTYNLQWTAAVCTVANLIFRDIQVGLRLWYR